jgi:hypothetical protein
MIALIRKLDPIKKSEIAQIAYVISMGFNRIDLNKSDIE